MNWIKCSDRSPKENQKVIASDNEHVGEYFFCKGYFETDEGYSIKATHWMPMSSPPKE